MTIINKKRYFFTMILTLLFLAVNLISPEITSITGLHTGYSIVYAAPKAAGGGFKSGGFKSSSSYSAPKSSTGGFKSGSFSKTPKSSSGSSSGGFTGSKSYSGSSNRSYDSGTKRSFIPIPIPIPWGGHSYFGSGYGSFGGGYFGPTHFIASIVGGIIKFILLIIVLIVIFNIIKKSRRRY